MDALIRGLPYAKQTAPLHFQVGFSVAEPAESLGGDDEFWQTLANVPTAQFADHVDYIGFGLYPDAFSPVSPEAVPTLTKNAIRRLRLQSLPTGKIPQQTPIHISEFGSPSADGKTTIRQARSTSDMVGTIEYVAEKLNITACDYFGLHDADTADGQVLGTSGLLDDDYAPKDSFEVYRDIVRP